MKKHIEKKALKKWKVIESFFTGPDDKRTTKIEISEKLHLMFCSFKRRSLVGSDVKILSLESGDIVQTIPPTICSKSEKSNFDDVTKELSFLSLQSKKMITRNVDDDLVARDHVITFAITELDDENFSKVHVVTTHASGLLREWFVVKEIDSGNLESEGSQESIVVHLKRTWKAFHQSPIAMLSFSHSDPIRGFVASGGSSDSMVKVWDLNQGYCTHSLKLHAGTVSVVSFHTIHREGKLRYYLLASGELKNSIQIFDLESSSQVVSLEGHVSMITAMSFLDNTTLLTVARDKMMISWNLNNFSSIKQIPVFDSIEDMLITDVDNRQVVVIAGHSGTLAMIDPQNGKVLTDAKSKNNKQTVNPLKQILSYDGNIIVVNDQNHIFFYSLSNYASTLEFELNYQLVGELDQVLCVRFVGSKDEHAVVASNSPLLKIYSLKDKNSCQVFHEHIDTILSIQVIPSDRNVFLTSSKDNTILLWRFNILKDNQFSAVPMFSGSGHFRSVTALALPFKGNDFALSASEDCILKVWKIPKSVYSESIDRKDVGQMVSLSSVRAHEKDINSISVAPTDQMIATGSKDKSCKLWSLDPKTKQLNLLTTLRGHRKTIWATDFSPVDKILLTASGDCTIKIWSLNDYSCLRTMSVNDSSVYLFAKFLSNGTQVIASSTDGLLRLFSVKTSEMVLSLDPNLHAEVIADMSRKPFKTDTSVIQTESGKDDGEVDPRIWYLDFNETENTLVLGSGCRIFLFKDNTKDAEENFMTKREQEVVYDQKLQNLLHKQEFDRAIGVAINLNRPVMCLDIMRQVTLAESKKSTDDSSSEKPLFGIERLEHVLNELRNDQLMYLLKMTALRWNTNSKHCIIAQLVMKVCLPKMISELIREDFSQDLTTLKSLIEAMICYSERHEARMKKHVMNSYLLHFLSQNVMSSLPTETIKFDEIVEDKEPMEFETPQEEPQATRNVYEGEKEENYESEELSSGEETEEAVVKKRILGDDKKMKKKSIKGKGKGKSKRKRKTRDRISV